MTDGTACDRGTVQPVTDGTGQPVTDGTAGDSGTGQPVTDGTAGDSGTGQPVTDGTAGDSGTGQPVTDGTGQPVTGGTGQLVTGHFVRPCTAWDHWPNAAPPNCSQKHRHQWSGDKNSTRRGASNGDKPRWPPHRAVFVAAAAGCHECLRSVTSVSGAPRVSRPALLVFRGSMSVRRGHHKASYGC